MSCAQPAELTPPSRCASSVIDRATDTLILIQVRRRIRVGQVAEADRDDLAQHLRQALLRVAHRYLPDHGAWSTFARTVVRSELQKWLRFRLQSRRNDNRAVTIYEGESARLADWAADITDRRSADAFTQTDRRAAVAEALAGLSPSDRQVAELLTGDRAATVQRHLGWSKRRLYQAIANIRVALSTVAGEV